MLRQGVEGTVSLLDLRLILGPLTLLYACAPQSPRAPTQTQQPVATLHATPTPSCQFAMRDGGSRDQLSLSGVQETDLSNDDLLREGFWQTRIWWSRLLPKSLFDVEIVHFNSSGIGQVTLLSPQLQTYRIELDMRLMGSWAQSENTSWAIGVVLAHEIAHIQLRHLEITDFDRFVDLEAEVEADERAGALFAQATEFDPQIADKARRFFFTIQGAHATPKHPDFSVRVGAFLKGYRRIHGASFNATSILATQRWVDQYGLFFDCYRDAVDMTIARRCIELNYAPNDLCGSVVGVGAMNRNLTGQACARLIRERTSSVQTDNDGDGIWDWIDICPTLQEDFNGIDDADGCPEEDRTEDRALRVTEPLEQPVEIRIATRVYFDSNSSSIKRKSYALLNMISQGIKENHDISLIQILGHRDDTEAVSVSIRRAEEVKGHLMKQGIAGAHMEVVDHASTQPQCGDIPDEQHGKRSSSREILACRAENRRVEFLFIINK